MAKYIEREAAYDAITDAYDHRFDEQHRMLRGVLNSIQTADVVPVVRCKDCEYWDRETIRQNSNDAGWWNEAICKEHTIYGNEHRDAWTSAEWYCADGERMDGEGDIQEELIRFKRDLNDCRNELCLRCGEYKRRHLGACDGCRWLEVGDAKT